MARSNPEAAFETLDLVIVTFCEECDRLCDGHALAYRTCDYCNCCVACCQCDTDTRAEQFGTRK